MSTKSRNRNSLLSSYSRSSYSNSSTKDEILAMKYLMQEPDLPIYPLSDHARKSSSASSTTNLTDTKTHTLQDQVEPAYPDFMPWKDHTQLSAEQQEKEHQKLNNASYLNKGYFETPQVANEYYSARNLILATVFLSNDNCNTVVKELSAYLTNAYKTRNEVINKIRGDSNHFKIPNRVTLTSNKKEAWLKELSNCSIPLQKIGEKIPHGLRNKVLIDAVCSRGVPINRSIWLTKCVLYGELISLRRKHQNRMSVSGTIPQISDFNTLEKFEIHWLQEWTQQVADYVLKFSREMAAINSIEKKAQYLRKFNYLINYVKSLYVESLLDKSFFLSLVLRFLKDGLPLQHKHVGELLSASADDSNRSMSSNNDGGDGGDDDNDDDDDLKARQGSWLNDVEMNYGQRLAALTLIKIFWNDLIKVDYLSKELSELLLLNYFFIDRWATSSSTPASYEKFALSDGLRFKLLKLISDTVKYLFELNCNIFIIPNYWMLIENSLVKIMLSPSQKGGSEKEHEEILKQLELIKYRNESLILNMKNEATVESNRMANRSASFSGFNSTAVSPAPSANVDNDYTFINRNSDDILNIIEKLDTLKFNEEFSNLLKPGRKGNKNWRLNLKVVLYWCVSPSRAYRDSIGDILFICNFLRNNVLAGLNKALKTEFDNEILEIIYQIAEDTNLNFVNSNLYVLINELYQLKLITIAAYLRKLIASGIFYLEPGTHQDLNNLPPVARTHLEILENLPVLNNRQCDSILKKWTPSGFDFKGKFTNGQAMLKKSIIDPIFNNSLSHHENVACTNYIRSLNVGLQFLLINWLTSEIKSTGSSATRLIHFTPAVVTNLYRFYSQTAGLTVFFKVIIPTILKNDGGMIIFYLDTLFLISKLTVRHFKLIKFIAGTHESGCTAYDIFKLIIQAYKDLSTREYDYFKFDNLWNFMDAVTEKAPESMDSTSNGGYHNNEQPLNKHSSSLVGKESLESPMHINTVEVPTTRLHTETRSASRRYTSTDFRNDIAYLRGLVPQPLSAEDAQEVRGVFDTDFSGSELQYWYDNFESLSEEKETALVKLLRSIMVSDHAFTTKIKDFIVELVKTSTDFQRITTFLKKMNIYDIVRTHELVKILLPVCSELGQESIIDEIVLGTEDSETKELTSSQQVLLQLNRHFYRVRSVKPYTMIILRGLLKGGAAYANDFFFKYKYPVLRFLNLAIATNTKVILSELYVKLPRDDCLELLNIQLGRTEDNFIKTLGDFEKFAPEIDEYNLPVCQVLLGVISNSLVSLDFVIVKEQLEHFMGALLASMNFRFSDSNSFFGELFSLMVWSHKVCILELLETKFLTETKFDNGIELYVTPTSQQNLLPPLNDFFKKFATSSSSSANSVASDKSLVQRLSDFINKLVDVVNSEAITEPTPNISSAISVFLRILIIHKLSLCEYISSWTTDELVISFVSKLIELLNSNYLNNNAEKLRILLYDLLLLMKSGITQEIHSSRDTELSDTTSPQTQSHQPLKLQSQHQDKDDHSEGTSPKSKDSKIENASMVSLIQNLFDLPEPSTANPFSAYLNDSLVKCSIMLDSNELEHGGDISVFNNRGLVLKSTRNDNPELPPFDQNNLMKSKSKQLKEFKFKSFEVLEDIGANSLNDGCLNLQLFDAYTTRENPP
ncbi:Mediator of RNA polymerase II transcription subunit 12 [Candida viswanathii]|uniref:Mediator of RNA polymerase II transcription subunit 12 n=1 Tax=Candida viswanathii TaxID=5486 RepID=A0A367YPB8_9ASCO|nr:Mediator of RNA polymerase II transcription subunit 12 [Candida viswanathii]